MKTRQFVLVPALIVSLALHALADRVLRTKSETVEEAGVSDAALVFVSDLQFDSLAEGREAETVRQAETAETVTQRAVEPVSTQAVSEPVYTADQKAPSAKPDVRSALAPILPVSDTENPILPGHVAEVRESETVPASDDVATVDAEKAEEVSKTQQAREQIPVLEENLKPDPIERAEPAKAVLPEAVEQEPVERTALHTVQAPPLQPVREKSEQHVDIIPVPRSAPAEYREMQARRLAAAEEASKKQAEKPARTKKTSSGSETTGNNGNSTSSARKGQQVTGNVADGRNAGVSGNAAVSNYPGKIRRKLMRSIRLPRKLNRRHVVTVRFTVNSGGGVSSAVVTRSSGSKDIDGRALQAVHRAAPFPKIPAAARKNSWRFTIPLEFRAR